MKLNTVIYILAVPILALVAFMGFRYAQQATFPSGPVTASQMRSLTNVVQQITSESIYRVDTVEAGRVCRVYVFTGSPATQHRYLMGRTRFSWEVVPTFSVKP
jgi:hypothetical protein